MYHGNWLMGHENPPPVMFWWLFWSKEFSKLSDQTMSRCAKKMTIWKHIRYRLAIWYQTRGRESLVAAEGRDIPLLWKFCSEKNKAGIVMIKATIIEFFSGDRCFNCVISSNATSLHDHWYYSHFYIEENKDCIERIHTFGSGSQPVRDGARIHAQTCWLYQSTLHPHSTIPASRQDTQER